MPNPRSAQYNAELILNRENRLWAILSFWPAFQMPPFRRSPK